MDATRSVEFCRVMLCRNASSPPFGSERFDAVAHAVIVRSPVHAMPAGQSRKKPAAKAQRGAVPAPTASGSRAPCYGCGELFEEAAGGLSRHYAQCPILRQREHPPDVTLASLEAVTAALRSPSPPAASGDDARMLWSPTPTPRPASPLPAPQPGQLEPEQTGEARPPSPPAESPANDPPQPSLDFDRDGLDMEALLAGATLTGPGPSLSTPSQNLLRMPRSRSNGTRPPHVRERSGRRRSMHESAALGPSALFPMASRSSVHSERA